MTADLPVPDGFSSEVHAAATLLAADEFLDEFKREGLDRASGWQRRLETSADRPGRGPSAVLALASGTSARLKQLRRGGAAGPLWRQRFPGWRRVLDNLLLPIEAVRRGVATPRPLALLLVEGPAGLFRGWLAQQEIERATDLLSAFASDPPPDRPDLAVAMNAVRRMHDAGVEHRDLNLGNLLLVDRASEDLRAMVIDLDGARLHSGALGFGLRQEALRRLERSYVKNVSAADASETPRDLFYALYAGSDSELAARLERGRAVGRGRIWLHGLGWPR